VVNPIGCGDCLAAGIAVGVESGLEMVEAVSLGIAAARENARSLLPARIDREAVHHAAESLPPPERLE
jgi:fructose-1-phosphate kinase PfkB-like protein